MTAPCGHSACRQNYVDTGEMGCIASVEPEVLALIVRVLQQSRPLTKPGTYAVTQREAVRGQLIGWDYVVTKFGDTLQHLDPTFDRARFRALCEGQTDR